MQLKLKRSTEQGGIIFKKTFYRLDAMLSLTDEEKEQFKKYNQWKATIIPSKQAIKGKNIDDEYNQEVLSMTTFASLVDGIVFTDNKISLIEDVEIYISSGVAAVKKYIEDLESFDGTSETERVIDFSGENPKIISTD